jgi:hypothetical protein
MTRKKIELFEEGPCDEAGLFGTLTHRDDPDGFGSEFRQLLADGVDVF